MLETMRFNHSLYRYRAESLEQGVVYNLRYGTLFFVKGNLKRIIEQTINQGYFFANVKNKAIDYLVKNQIFLRQVEENGTCLK